MQYQMDGTLDPRPKRGPDVKIIIQSLKLLSAMEHGTDVSRPIACNPAKMFKSSIQHANDSGSMDTSLEYKTLFTNENKSKLTHRQPIPYVNELREILNGNKNKSIKRNSVGQTINGIETPTKLPFTNRKNLPEIPAESKPTEKSDSKTPQFCEKHIDLLPLSKKMPASSTPYRPKHDNEMNNNCKGALNLMTPSADVRFIDADEEATTGELNGTLVKCFSLTRASCRRMASFRRTLRKQSSNSEILSPSSPQFERGSFFTSSFNVPANRSSIVSTDEISPLRRQENIKIKNSKLLNFFRSTKINADNSTLQRESDLSQTCNNLSRLLEKSDQHFDDLGCTPLLTKDNVDLHANHFDEIGDCDKTIGWGNKFEFSFICEPSTSDIGEEDELEYFPSTNCRKKLPNVPFLKLSPPSRDSGDSEQLKRDNTNNSNINSSPFRRSISDPALIRLATIHDKTNTDPFCASDTNDPFDPFQCATANTTRTLPNNHSSPFRRWGQSSFRSRSNDLAPTSLTNRRPSSLVASENDVFSKSADNDDDICSLKSKGSDATSTANVASTKVTVDSEPTSHGVQVWGNSFEKLLEDAAGLHTFAEFLKKEFSAENIYFWTACERYRKINDHIERTKEANGIYSKHLATGASEPVNVDSMARTLAQERLNYAEPDLFLQAQKQIFNLMKFDSYQRFIRSDLYKSCLVAEQQKKPLPYPGHQLDPSLRTIVEIYDKAPAPVASSKLKKSLSNAEDRRRKSLLPWHRKTRCKSKDRNEEFLRNETQKNGANSQMTVNINQSQNDIHSSRSSLSSFDAAISSRPNGAVSPVGSGDDSPPRSSLCRVILSDGATTIVQTRHHESIRTLIDRLLEKRGIFYEAYEGFVAGTNKPIDLNVASTSVAGKEVLIEQRVVFKLDLPNKKIISVKSKPCKLLSEVLKPILQKYNYQLDMVTVYTKTHTEPMPINAPVTSADGLRLLVVLNDDVQVSTQETTLNEITNKVFNELMQKKTDLQSKHLDINQGSSIQANQHQPYLPSQQEDVSGRSDDWCSESSSGNFGQLRQPIFKGRPLSSANKQRKFSITPSSSNVSILTSISSKDNSISSKTLTEGGSPLPHNGISNDEASKKPLIAKWKTGARLQNTSAPSADGKDLLEDLKRAQRFRLEDQRGTEINFELPDFLKDNNTNKWKNMKIATHDANNSKHVHDVDMQKKTGKAPQPAPRLYINRSTSTENSSFSEAINENGEKSQGAYSSYSQGSENSDTSPQKYSNGTLPPPLPPKPKVKPTCWAGNSNWQPNDTKADAKDKQSLLALGVRNIKAPIADRINMLSATLTDKKMPPPRTIYFDRMNSSFV